MNQYFPHGQFLSPSDDFAGAERQQVRDGLLLADAARERFGSVLEALAWVTHEWRAGQLDHSKPIMYAAQASLLERATGAEAALWARAEASGCVLSVEDMRWWIDADVRRLEADVRRAA